LSVPKGDHRRVDVSRELVDGRRTVEAIRERLRSAFPIQDWALRGERQTLATDANTVAAALDRFERLQGAAYVGLQIGWEPFSRNGTLRVERDLLPGAAAGGGMVSHLEAEERQAIEAALRTSRGRISGANGAARRLGLPASTLEFRIRRLGIDKFRYRTANNT